MLDTSFKMSKWKILRFERETRYYELRLQQDFWGQWEIAKVFVSNCSRQVRMIFELFDDFDRAKQRFESLVLYRIHKRQYQPDNQL